MTLHTSADALITCTYWDEVVAEDGFLALGRNRYHCSYVIYTDGTYTYAENGTTGNLDYGGPNNLGGVSGTDATAVIHAAWGNMPNGGKIHLKGTINLGVNGLTFNLVKNVKDLVLEGEGETRTLIQYTGTDYAITISTTDTVLGYYGAVLSRFRLDGIALTAGRNGIKIDKVGRRVRIENIYVSKFDIGICVYDTNGVSIKYSKVIVANTGIRCEGVAFSSPNGITIMDAKITSCVNYGIYWLGGVAGRIYGGSIESNGVGVFIRDNYNIMIHTVYFGGNTVVDIDLHGTSSTYQIHSAVIDDCYFNSSTPHAITVYFARNVTVRNPKSRGHTTAFLWMDDRTHQILIENPNSEDPQLLDGNISDTQPTRRLGGSVVDFGRYGVFARNGTGSAVTAGDVVVWTGTGLVTDSAGANDDNPGVIMYGGTDGTPVVVCVKGITPVTVGALTALEDTLVASNVVPNALTNNAQTDPKKIIGYTVAGTAGAGTAYVRVL